MLALRRTSLPIVFAFVASCAAAPAPLVGVVPAPADAEAPPGVGSFTYAYKRDGFITSQREADLALLQCAQIARGDGYEFFVIVESSPGGTFPSREVMQAAARGLLSAGNADPASVTTFMGRKYLSVRPGNVNVLVGFRSAPDGFFYVTQSVISGIKAKYGIEG